MISTLRRASKTTTVVIALGLLGTLGADIATAASGGPGSAVGAGRHGASHADDPAVRAYLTALRPVATGVEAAVGPAQGVLQAIVEPHAGDAFAARDAIANGDALSRLQSARRQLAALHEPEVMTARQRALVTAAKQLSVTLTQARTLRPLVNGNRIMTKLDGVTATRLGTAEYRWNTALESAYRGSSLTAPRDFRDFTNDAANRTKWIFGADRACSAASFRLTNLSKYQGMLTPTEFTKWAGLWSRTLSWIGHRLTGLSQPRGASGLPTLLRSHLKVLSYNAKLFDLEIKGVKHQSPAQVSRSIERIHELMPTLRLLASSMSSYGAKTCGLVIGLWSGKPLPNLSARHRHASLNT